jgi:hypothetical protein
MDPHAECIHVDTFDFHVLSRTHYPSISISTLLYKLDRDPKTHRISVSVHLNAWCTVIFGHLLSTTRGVRMHALVLGFFQWFNY